MHRILEPVYFLAGLVGAALWNPAFKKGTVDNYDDLTLSEKIGYKMFEWMLSKKFDSKEELESFVEKACQH